MVCKPILVFSLNQAEQFFQEEDNLYNFSYIEDGLWIEEDLFFSNGRRPQYFLDNLQKINAKTIKL